MVAGGERSELLSPLQGSSSFLRLFRGLASLTPGYHLVPLRGSAALRALPWTIMKKNNVKEIAKLAQKACILEVCAEKPGNINRRYDFSDASFEDYILSAIAIGTAFESAPRLSIGQMIWQAASDTRKLVQSNTNLGMILLMAPLVKGCENASDLDGLRKNVRAELAELTVEDARLAYEAIRLANPGGLGKAPEADVAEEPTITLLQAMKLAQKRDSIASEYASGFEITFEIGYPALRKALSAGADFSSAVVQAFLAILGKIPDTLIARKRDFDTARQVSIQAAEVLNKGGIFKPEGRTALAELDKELRDPGHSLNPGTTADLTAAAIFVSLIV